MSVPAQALWREPWRQQWRANGPTPPKRRKFDDFRSARASAGQWTVYAMSKPSSSASFGAIAKASTRRLRSVEETNAQANAAQGQETQWRRKEREKAGAR